MSALGSGRADLRPDRPAMPAFQIDGLLEPGKELSLAIAIGKFTAARARSALGHPVRTAIAHPDLRRCALGERLWCGFSGTRGEQHSTRSRHARSDRIAGPLVVIPGHGKVFTHVAQSLAAARRRLDGFVRDPMKHATHARKCC